MFGGSTIVLRRARRQLYCVVKTVFPCDMLGWVFFINGNRAPRMDHPPTAFGRATSGARRRHGPTPATRGKAHTLHPDITVVVACCHPSPFARSALFAAFFMGTLAPNCTYLCRVAAVGSHPSRCAAQTAVFFVVLASTSGLPTPKRGNYSAMFKWVFPSSSVLTHRE